MGRRALRLGEAGTLITYPYRHDGDGWVRAESARDAQSWWSTAYVRDWDGVRRKVIRKARTKLLAEQEAKRAIEKIVNGDAALLDEEIPFLEYGELWLERIEQSGNRSKGTIRLYKQFFNNQIRKSNLKALTLGQANHPQRIRRCLQGVADNSGAGAVKSVKVVLTGILQEAIHDGILDDNAAAKVKTPSPASTKEKKRDHERSATREERDNLLALAYARCERAADPRTIRKAWAVADLLSLQYGLGLRIEEARSLTWEMVDLDANRFMIPRVKTNAGERLVSGPEWLLERLRARAARTGREGYVVPSPGLTDPTKKWEQSNSQAALRSVLDEAGMEWAVPHTGRRTVINMLRDAGTPLNKIADFVGHEDESSTRAYLSRDFGDPKRDLSRLL